MPTVYFFVTDTFADWEPGHVLAELRSGRYLKDPSARFDTVVCAADLRPVTSMGGIRLVPDKTFSGIRPQDGDLVLLPGADTWLDPVQAPVIEKVKEVLDDGIVVAAICGATLALAEAGLLDQRPHTSNDLAVLKMFCPRYRGEAYYVNEPAVADGNLITASGLAPVEFAYQVFRTLGVMNTATLDAWYQLCTTRKPESFAALMDSLHHRPNGP